MDGVHVVLALLGGGAVGFSLGLIGGGGSILATPLLLYVVGVPEPHVAIGTGALAVSVNAFANLVTHARSGNVRWRAAAIFAAVGVVGASLGASLGKALDGHRLLFLFALLMIAVGALMLRPRRARAGGAPPPPLSAALVARLAATGLAVGGLSGFFGIGGGFLIVPGLVLATGMPMINAIGSSLLAVGSFGLTTAASYALSGLVAWTTAGVFITGGVLGGFGGLRLAMHLSVQRDTLSRVFAGVIFIVAGYMLYRD